MTDQIFYTEGAENTFFLTFSESLNFKDLRSKAEELELDPDGYILAPKLGAQKVKFDFFNKDQSQVDFCGNALRAVGLCFFEAFQEKDVTIVTPVGEMRVHVGEDDQQVTAQMPAPEVLPTEHIDGHQVPHILSGVPHLVFDVSHFPLDLNNEKELVSFCESVRGKNLNGVETHNLTFYSLDTTDTVECVTYERGVEGLTKACGSGALSVFAALGGSKGFFQMPGGRLHIFKNAELYFMKGPAKIMKRIEL